MDVVDVEVGAVESKGRAERWEEGRGEQGQ